MLSLHKSNMTLVLLCQMCSMHCSSVYSGSIVCDVQAANDEKEALREEVASLKSQLQATHNQVQRHSSCIHKVSWVRQQRMLHVTGLSV